jgi:hypothetical protein
MSAPRQHQPMRVYQDELNELDKARYTGAISTVLQLQFFCLTIFLQSLCVALFITNERLDNVIIILLILCFGLQLFLICQTFPYVNFILPSQFHRRQLVRIDRVTIIYALIYIGFPLKIELYSGTALLTFLLLAIQSFDLFLYSFFEKELHRYCDGEPWLLRFRRAQPLAM